MWRGWRRSVIQDSAYNAHTSLHDTRTPYTYVQPAGDRQAVDEINKLLEALMYLNRRQSLSNLCLSRDTHALSLTLSPSPYHISYCRQPCLPTTLPPTCQSLDINCANVQSRANFFIPCYVTINSGQLACGKVRNACSWSTWIALTLCRVIGIWTSLLPALSSDPTNKTLVWMGYTFLLMKCKVPNSS